MVLWGWGKVLEFEHGWRAEQAELVALGADPTMPGDDLCRLAKRYGVEVWSIHSPVISMPPHAEVESVYEGSLRFLIAMLGQRAVQVFEEEGIVPPHPEQE